MTAGARTRKVFDQAAMEPVLQFLDQTTVLLRRRQQLLMELIIVLSRLTIIDSTTQRIVLLSLE